MRMARFGVAAVHFAKKFVEGAINAGKSRKHFGDAGNGDLVGVHHRVHARLAHGMAAAAEDFHAWQPRPERPRQARAIDVAGALTGNDHDGRLAHNSSKRVQGHGNRDE